MSASRLGIDMTYYTKEERRAYAKGAAKVEERLAIADHNLEVVEEQLANARAENKRWQRQSLEGWQAFQAMRDSINEYIPMPSLESNLRYGPEFSFDCELLAEAIINHVKPKRNRLLTFLARFPIF